MRGKSNAIRIVAPGLPDDNNDGVRLLGVSYCPVGCHTREFLSKINCTLQITTLLRLTYFSWVREVGTAAVVFLMAALRCRQFIKVTQSFRIVEIISCCKT